MGRTASIPELIRRLLSPDAYSHTIDGPIELIQTHISYVVLAGAYAYKIKKPLDLGFLDYSTLERRRFMCEEEVRLNRRLCPEAYVGVSYIVQSRDGRARVDGDGDVVEYAVKMRRMPKDRMMPELLDRAAVGSTDVRALARLIAQFHDRAAHDDRIAQFGSLEAIRENWDENFAQVEPGTGRAVTAEELTELQSYVADSLASRASLFERRAAEGRIRDCHGDLRSDSVVIHPDGSICVMDCIEFSDRIRYGDVASDIGFLAMDLDYRGHPTLADELIGVYLGASRDETLPLVLPFYRAYRAVVRGKVETILSEEPEVPHEQREAARDRARAYFSLALGYARRPLVRSLVLMVGLTGSGKSYLANAVAGRAAMALVSSDNLRVAGTGANNAGEVYGGGRYSDEARAAVYAEMRRRAAFHLQEGDGVILDATHIVRAERMRAYELAREAGVPLVIVHVIADETRTREHLAARTLDATTASEGRWDIYLAQREAFDELDEVPSQARVVTVDGGGPLVTNVERMMAALI